MARLRQQYPGNYRASPNISAEFENVIRYMNAAELGNKTLGELVGQLFDDNGQWHGPIEFTRDLDGSIKYRVGEYALDTDGWVTLASAEDIKGVPGANLGEVDAPVIYGRYDIVPGNGATEIEYAHEADEDLLVFVDGVLAVPDADYTFENTGGVAGNGSVTFVTPFTGTETLTLYRVRANAISNYVRVDHETIGDTFNFAFAHESGDKLNVYLNGILQREGLTYDYTSTPSVGQVSFNTSVPAGNIVTIITVESTAAQVVSGLMTEASYCSPDTGLIRLDRIGIPDGSFPQAKVIDLASTLAKKGNLTVSTTSPVEPATGDFWFDIASNPNLVKVWNGIEWLMTSPENTLPSYSTSNAEQYLRVNGTGTALEFVTPDLSAVIPRAERGAANGVAALDASGRLPSSQLPELLGSATYYRDLGTAAAGSYSLNRIFQQSVTITGIAIRTTSGTCNVQLALNGVGTGPVYSAATAPYEITIGSPVAADATLASIGVGVIVSSPSSLAGLEVSLAVKIKS
ncbi:hypothetical protein [Poseidonocella sp. HB161398]|uniref:hypothetical protein n=1 Tax=Poseidonocella sp. HB161398 TaxID=2320855 RepID=UPI00110858EA|nr:hypothetical protein [Poseidonocella sp. HB161398]